MDFTNLIADFAQRHGIANLAAEDNATALDIDGVIVTLIAVNDVLSVSAEIGEPPADGRADFAELLLEANMQSEAFFAKAPGGDSYILVRRIALPTLEPADFDNALEAFINMVETWRRLLADFRPAAKAAAESAQADPEFAVQGFMQV